MTSATSPPIVLRTPAFDLSELNDRMGRAWGVSCGESIPQYLAWSEQAGIFDALRKPEPVSTEALVSMTPLNRHGVDALLPILTSLKLVERDAAGAARLTPLAREFLLRESPYYVGGALYWDCTQPIPGNYLTRGGDSAYQPPPLWPAELRTVIPHCRNFAPTVVAARSGEFDRVDHLVDIGGGSGVLAIPLALDRPSMRVTLVDLPDAIPGARESLASYGVDTRIELIGMDVFRDAWSFGACDGIFLGNIFHGCDDDGCRFLGRKSWEALSPGGTVWIHEVVFNERKDGPLLAALWNANVIVRRPMARQRTIAELSALLDDSGFTRCHARPTAGDFWLVAGRKPRATP